MASFSEYFSAFTSINIMLSRILMICLCLFLLSSYTDSAPVSKAKQYIAPIPGFIPVYIRPGDTPLEDINLDLAEAFESYAAKHGRFAFARSTKIDDNKIDDSKKQIDGDDTAQLVKDEDEKMKHGDSAIKRVLLVKNDDISEVNLDDFGLDEHVVRVAVIAAPQHIQKIPRQ